jgi:ABC-type transport system substrate-binding protein
VDRLLDAIRQEYDRDKIIALAGELQSTIFRDQPYLFLYVPESTTVMWKDTYRIRRPGPDGSWIDSPIEATKAGWSYWGDWFYRPEFSDRLPAVSNAP